MSDSEEECKLREDLWSSFCSVSRFQISGLLIRQASSSAVPAVRWGLACFFELAFTQGWVQGCPQRRHRCTRVPSLRAHRGARANTCCCALLLRGSMCICARTKENWKKAGMGGRGLLTSTPGKAEKEHNLAGSSPNQSHFYPLFFFPSLPPSSISEYAMVLGEYLSPAPQRWNDLKASTANLSRAGKGKLTLPTSRLLSLESLRSIAAVN